MCGDTNNLSSVNLGRTEHVTWCNMPIVLSVIMFMHVSLTICSMSCTPNANCNRQQELLPENICFLPSPWRYEYTQHRAQWCRLFPASTLTTSHISSITESSIPLSLKYQLNYKLTLLCNTSQTQDNKSTHPQCSTTKLTTRR
jgi:hypothetical protein